jgi:ABC-type Fe3+-hydroxamate transport system substrate-binding protein
VSGRPEADDGALVDAIGQVHRPAGPGSRIVSLVPSLTELLFDLGLDRCVVGRTTFCIHPAEVVAQVPRVGGTKKVRLDRLERLDPTHVLVNVDENDRTQVEAIRSFVPNVVVTHPLAPDDNLGLYRLVGGIFGREHEARALAGRFRTVRERLAERVRALTRRRVLYLIWREPWMTVSRDTYVSRTLALASLDTVAHDSGVRYPAVDLAAAARDADVVLLSSEPFPFRPRHHDEVREAVGARPLVLDVDGEMTSWYGSRAVAGLEYLSGFATDLARRLG